MAIITLTTDFGSADGYVGAMKAMILRWAGRPFPVIVDIAHDIPPGDIAHAAWVVATATPVFPEDSIHVVVVDPGVGGARREVIVAANECWYVGPDNGVFAYVTGGPARSAEGHAPRPIEAYAIESPRFRAEKVSPTFHGRDVFACAAGALAVGRWASGAGPRVTLSGQLPWGPRELGVGRIVHVDRFGNLITDLPASELSEAGTAVILAGMTLPVVGTYEDVAPGHELAYIGSAGTIEIAVRDGRADQRFAAPRGTLVLPATDPAIRGPYR